MPETRELTITPAAVPVTPDGPDTADISDIIALRNADFLRVRGSDDYAITVAQALPYWQDQTNHRQYPFVARSDGVAVASASAELPLEHGSRSAGVNLRVRHDLWGQGIGTTMLAHIEGVVRDEGRTIAQAWTEHPPAEGERLGARTGWGSVPDDHVAQFLRHRGFVLEQVYRNSRLELEASIPRVLELADQARAAAGDTYRFVSWELPTPEEHLDDFALLKSRMSTDAPTGDVEVDAEAWDGDRVRRMDERDRKAGFRKIVGAVEHVESRRLVAFNELSIDLAKPELTYQNDTLVLKEHRGHRLGMLVKCETLLGWVALVPDTRRIETFNAEENRPMLDINEAMGFEPILYAGEWQKRLG